MFFCAGNRESQVGDGGATERGGDVRGADKDRGGDNRSVWRADQGPCRQIPDNKGTDQGTSKHRMGVKQSYKNFGEESYFY